MNFIEELKWRNMLHQMTDGADEHVANGGRVGYIGFDPTAPSLTIGNYVQVMLLNLFQRSGNTPIVLMGGATGRIGDPSGKDKERELKTEEELDANLSRQLAEVRRFINFEDGPNKAIIANNLDFYKEMNVLDFMRNVGKTLTVNYMLSKESVKKRLETGISFTEFSYQLLQGYDFQCLYKRHGCTVQMGGSDQWGNITAGTEFVSRNLRAKAHGVTTPLLTKADGTKFGKSTAGNIWMNGDMTSPYKFFQFWINAADSDIPKFIRYFTFKTKEQVEAEEAQYADDPRMLKKLLAEELTKRIHGDESFQAVEKVSDLLFNKKAKKETLLSLSSKDLATVAEEIPSFKVSKDALSSGLNIIDLMAENTSIVPSKSEARRAIKGQAVSVNKDKVKDAETVINHESLLHGRYMMLENGKKNKFMLVAD
ncbi:MAG: tyrosine--tRNA ligase [Bacteroidota bacterium]